MNNTNFPENDTKEEDIEFVSIEVEEDSDNSESSSNSESTAPDTPVKAKLAKGDIIRYVIMGISLIVFIAAAVILIYYLVMFVESRKLNNDIDPSARETQDATTEFVDDDYNRYHFEISNVIDFELLESINPSVAGWISFPLLGIEYPIAQHESSNDYYLKQASDGSEMYTGAIYLDTNAKADWSDMKITVYGHRLDEVDGGMFTKLLKYDSEKFYKENKERNLFYIYTPENVRIYEVFSVTDVTYKEHSFVFDARIPSTCSSTEFDEYISKIELYDTGIEITDEDQILTLYTCQAAAATGVRHMVHGRLVSIIDNDDIKTSDK